MAKSKSVIDEASRYLASTLHEIRTPIQTIIGTIELLQDTNMDKEQREYIRQIQFSAEVLLDLANNILDFSKIRSNEFKLENVPFNISELTEQVVNLISIEAFNRGLEVITDIDNSIPQLVSGDPVRVQQIILNLLKNAVKFTNDGYIHIELKKNKKSIYFCVTDTGIGITEGQKAKLFTDYYQADISTYRKFGGTGLGLSICKNLVDIMQGKIGVDSNPEGGSKFWLELPLNAVLLKTVEKNLPKETLSKKILIVDDSILAATSLKKLLIDAGLKDIEITNSPEQGIFVLKEAQAQEKKFDIVFIDMIMPSLDGWHLASDIKNTPELDKNLKLYLLVPEGQMKSEAKMKMLNWFEGYLYKPFLRSKVQELLFETVKSSEAEIEELELADEDTIIEQTKNDANIAEGYKILIAEDHPVNRKLLETFVKKSGADVYLAEDGLEAVEQVQITKDIDLIFMDIQMPIKSGVEATVELRKNGYTGIIIACTANNDQNDFDSYLKAGINDIIVKPFKSDTIKTILEKWVTVMKFPQIQKIATLSQKVTTKDDAWDKADFMDTVGNDKNLAKNILNTYIEQTNSTIRLAEKSLKDKDFESLRKIGHALSGSSLSISAKKLGEYAQKINAGAKKADKSACSFALEEFEHEYKIFKELIKEFGNA